jgi:tetratricopeptide (TPR) repeat protein
MVAAKVNHLLFGADEKNIPLATKYDFNFQKGRYLGEVKKDYKASIEYLDKNISGPDPHLPSLFGAARSRIFGNIEVEKAIGLLRQYLALRPQASPSTQSAVWWLTGQGYERLEETQKAEECYRKSLEITPDFERAKESLKQLSRKKQKGLK